MSKIWKPLGKATAFLVLPKDWEVGEKLKRGYPFKLTAGIWE